MAYKKYQGPYKELDLQIHTGNILHGHGQHPFQFSTGLFKVWPLFLNILFHPIILSLNRTYNEFCQ